MDNVVKAILKAKKETSEIITELVMDRMHIKGDSFERPWDGIKVAKKPAYAKTILGRTDITSDQSCQRSILELCALKMNDTERLHLVGPLKIQEDDELFQILRKQKFYVIFKHYLEVWDEIFNSGVDDSWKLRQENIINNFLHVECNTIPRFLDREFYRVNRLGQKAVVDALYKIIRANPAAFCQLLAQEEDSASKDKACQAAPSTIPFLSNLKLPLCFSL